MSLAIKKIIKILFSVSLLLGLIWIANPKDLLNSLKQVSIADFSLLMLLSFLMIAISAFKWQLFIECLGAKVSLLRLFALYLTGYFINIIFPSYIGGDALRSYYIGKSVGQHQALSATFLERYTGLLAMAVLGMLAALYESQLIDFTTRALVVAIGVVVIAVTVAAFYLRISADKFKNKYIRKILVNLSKLHELIIETSKSPGVWVQALIVSLFYHFLTVANTYVAGWALGWSDPPIMQLFVVLPIILIISAIPITPSGLGLQEGAFFHFLQVLGATAPQALGVAVILRAKTYVLAFFGWLVWSYMGKINKREIEEGIKN